MCITSQNSQLCRALAPISRLILFSSGAGAVLMIRSPTYVDIHDRLVRLVIFVAIRQWCMNPPFTCSFLCVMSPLRMSPRPH